MIFQVGKVKLIFDFFHPRFAFELEPVLFRAELHAKFYGNRKVYESIEVIEKILKFFLQRILKIFEILRWYFQPRFVTVTELVLRIMSSDQLEILYRMTSISHEFIEEKHFLGTRHSSRANSFTFLTLIFRLIRLKLVPQWILWIFQVSRTLDFAEITLVQIFRYTYW